QHAPHRVVAVRRADLRVGRDAAGIIIGGPGHEPRAEPAPDRCALGLVRILARFFHRDSTKAASAAYALKPKPECPSAIDGAPDALGCVHAKVTIRCVATMRQPGGT